MRLLNFLKEFQTLFGGAGRGTALPGQTIIWIYITNPKFVGLIWSDPKGTIYRGKHKIVFVSNWDDTRSTHKNLVAKVYSKISDLKISGNLRSDVDKIVDMYDTDNPRGRVIKNKIYIYPFGSSNPLYKKNVNKAVNSIYDYVNEEYITS